mmetsp:Transcript_7191/g.10038  ORF Transcript_7191/g.10038 Transcript_7191/m.10038 type:complete len:282 (+) Transcript_7191:91-936(+)
MESQDRKFGFEFDTHYRAFSFRVVGAKRSREEVLDSFYERIQAAFKCLEDLISEGMIGHYYGVSSSLQGCDYSVTGRSNVYEGPSLRRLLAVAKQVEDEHRMRVVQIPFNLVESGPVLQTLYDPDAEPDGSSEEKGRFVTAIEAAASKGVSVIGNRAINAIPPEGIGAGDWGRGETYWKLRDKHPMSPELALMRDTIMSKLHADANVDYSDMHQIQHLALWAASSANGITAQLCGALQPKYVQDIARVLQKPCLGPSISKSAFAAVRQLLIELSPSHADRW